MEIDSGADELERFEKERAESQKSLRAHAGPAGVGDDATTTTATISISPIFDV